MAMKNKEWETIIDFTSINKGGINVDFLLALLKQKEDTYKNL